MRAQLRQCSRMIFRQPAKYCFLLLITAFIYCMTLLVNYLCSVCCHNMSSSLQLPLNLPLVVISLCLHILFQLEDHALQELPALLLRAGVLSRAAGGTGWLLWLMAGTEAGQEFLLGDAAGRAGAGAAALPTLCLGQRGTVEG